MDKPISVGDMVMVVRDCCSKYLGLTFRVEEVWTPSQGVICTECRLDFGSIAVAETGMPKGIPAGRLPLAWLKRIPPLSELEGEKTDEKKRVSLNGLFGLTLGERPLRNARVWLTSTTTRLKPATR